MLARLLVSVKGAWFFPLFLAWEYTGIVSWTHVTKAYQSGGANKRDFFLQKFYLQKFYLQKLCSVLHTSPCGTYFSATPGAVNIETEWCNEWIYS